MNYGTVCPVRKPKAISWGDKLKHWPLCRGKTGSQHGPSGKHTSSCGGGGKSSLMLLQHEQNNNNYKCQSPEGCWSDTDSTTSTTSSSGWTHMMLHSKRNVRCALFAVCVVFYANSLHGDFVFDDVTAIKDNKVILCNKCMGFFATTLGATI